MPQAVPQAVSSTADVALEAPCQDLVKPYGSGADLPWMARRRRLVVTAAFLLASCGLTGCITKMSEVDLRTHLDRASAQVPRRQAIRELVPICPETRMEAWIYLAEARTSPNGSVWSVTLGRGFADGRRYKIDYIVGGPYPELVDQVILNGLAMNKGASLPGLRIVIVSTSEPTPKLRAAAEALQVRIEHRSIP